MISTVNVINVVNDINVDNVIDVINGVNAVNVINGLVGYGWAGLRRKGYVSSDIREETEDLCRWCSPISW